MGEITNWSRTKKDWIWEIAKNSWKLASTFGTAIFVIAAVCLHLYGWFMDDPNLFNKASTGLLWAIAYGIATVVWKIIQTWDETEVGKEVETKKKK